METTKADYWFTHIGEIRYENERIGHHWFDAETLRFFGSRVLPTVYGGRYFISSEDTFDRTGRDYSVRIAHADGSIDTVGEHGAYATRAEAVRAVKAILAGRKTGENK